MFNIYNSYDNARFADILRNAEKESKTNNDWDVYRPETKRVPLDRLVNILAAAFLVFNNPVFK